MAGKVGVRNIQPPHRHHDAHVRREPGMGRQPVRFRFPATLLDKLLQLVIVPAFDLVFALDQLLAGKMFFFAAAVPAYWQISHSHSLVALCIG